MEYLYIKSDDKKRTSHGLSREGAILMIEILFPELIADEFLRQLESTADSGILKIGRNDLFLIISKINNE